MGDLTAKTSIFGLTHRGKACVYNIKVLKRILGDDVCCDMLFAHAFSGCDTTLAIFGIGKKAIFHKVINGDTVLRNSAKTRVHYMHIEIS